VVVPQSGPYSVFKEKENAMFLTTQNILREMDKRAHERNIYPPYNIVRLSEEDYHIEIATAGFDKDDFQVEQLKNDLLVSGSRPNDDTDDREYIYRGIGRRSFRLKFKLADGVTTEGLRYEDGLLIISLKRVIPEEEKPKILRIEG
jgi:molecular chaperone IbpA